MLKESSLARSQPLNYFQVWLIHQTALVSLFSYILPPPLKCLLLSAITPPSTPSSCSFPPPLRSQIEKQTCWGMWRLVLAASVCGTGNSGFKWVGEGAVGWSGRSHENAVVNCAAAFQRRCNDRELGRKMEPQLESKKLKHVNTNWWEDFSVKPLRSYTLLTLLYSARAD